KSEQGNRVRPRHQRTYSEDPPRSSVRKARRHEPDRSRESSHAARPRAVGLELPLPLRPLRFLFPYRSFQLCGGLLLFARRPRRVFDPPGASRVSVQLVPADEDPVLRRLGHEETTGSTCKSYGKGAIAIVAGKPMTIRFPSKLGV